MWYSLKNINIPLSFSNTTSSLNTQGVWQSKERLWFITEGILNLKVRQNLVSHIQNKILQANNRFESQTLWERISYISWVLQSQTWFWMVAVMEMIEFIAQCGKAFSTKIVQS